MIETSYPLAPVQLGMLFHQLKGGAHAGVDLEQMVATLREEVDEDALRGAWTKVVERHAVLRTRFRWMGLDEPVQEALARVELPFTSSSLEGLSAGDRTARFDQLLRADRRRGFALDEAPLARVALVRFTATHHRLVWTFSHAILDGGSFAKLVGEVFAFYDALRGGADFTPPAPRPYRDHVEWVAAENGGNVARAAIYFRGMLAGFTAKTPLPASAPEHGAPAGPQIHGEEEVRLDLEQTAALRVMAKAQGVTLSTCVQAAWALVLSAHSGEDDVVFGATRACRRTALPEAPDMVGIFVNTLPVRVTIEGASKVSDLLHKVRSAQIALRDFEHTPLVDVLGVSEIERGTPLFDSIVVFNEQRVDSAVRAASDAWQTRDVRFLEQTSFPLTIFAYAEPELSLSLSYDRAAFDAGTARRLLGQLSAVLVAMGQDADVPVRDLPRTSEAEQTTLVEDFGSEVAEYDREGTIHGLVGARARTTPDAVAVTFRDASLTCSELDARASSLARKLRTLGVGPDVRVGVFVDRSLDMVVALLGILKAGGAYVPLDPTYPRERLAWMLEDAKAPVVVTQTHLAESLPAHAAAVVLVDAHEATPDGPHRGPTSPATADNLAYVLFTSGSTGRPKGVMVSHRNVVSFFTGMDARLGADRPGVWLAVTSISFDISVLELFWTLARGFHVVVQESAPGASMPARAAPARRGVDFSLFYFATDAKDAGRDKYRLLLEGAAFADSHDFSAVWTPERHFHPFGGLYPNPSVTSAALAVLTKRIQIRAGSIVLPLHDPIRIAEEWSVVDNLSGGRVGLSFASGWHADDFALAPGNFAGRRAAMARGIETIRALWRGEEVPAKNGEGRDISVRIFPAAIQKDPPIWVAAAGAPDTFEMAGRIGANVLTNLLGQSVADLRAKVALYRTARREAGHVGAGHVTLMLHTFVGESVAAVRETVRRPFIDYLKTSTDLVKRARWEFPAFAQPGKARAGDAAADAGEAELSPADIDAMMSHAFDRYFETSGLFGTPESCLGMIHSLEDVGIDEIACLIDFGVADDTVLESLVHLDRLRRACVPRATDEAAWDIAAQLRRHGVTHLQCTPSLAGVLACDPEARAALSPLRMLLIGGEAFPPALASDLAGLVTGDVLNMYGPTETTVWSTTATIGKTGEPISVGRPIANTVAYILDANRALLPIGAAGELYLGGPGVARGYLDRPELTAERFVPSPFSHDPSARLYRTGDLARYRPTGELEIVGRVDHQVKIRGVRVELGEIEATLGEHPSVHESVVVVRDDMPGGRALAAYVVPRSSWQGDGADWRAIWDAAYGRPGSADSTFDLAGWTSSYTGSAIPEREMREWVDHTTRRILALSPRRVLELGCGTGMLLSRIAPHVDAYVGSDFSAPALLRVEAMLHDQGLSNVTLRNAAADDSSGLSPGSFDTIVLNSVSQYFPDTDYLVKVLTDALRLLAPGGAIFVGDVRNRALLPELYAAIELLRAPDSRSRAELAELARGRASREVELALDPDLFEALRAHLPEIADVSIQLKRGEHANELTRFRYDVVLRKAGGEPRPQPPQADEWTSAGPGSISDIRALLRAGPAVLGVRGLVNARVVRETMAARLLRDPSGPATAGELRAALAVRDEGIDPEAMFRLDSRYDVDVTWSPSAGPGAFDVVFRHRMKSSPARVAPSPVRVATPLAVHGNRPARGRSDEPLGPTLRAHLASRLPEAMVPAAITFVEALPRTPNGKVDRSRLPAPGREVPAVTDHLAPATPIEETIAAVWRQILDVEHVGAHDNFFDLGANSLLMMQANTKLRAALGSGVTLVDMFRFTTVSALAAHLSAKTGDGEPLEASQDRARKRTEAMSLRRSSRMDPERKALR
jgi:natural product biosynthesis luciferase-like monooxygenase protein